MGEGGFFAHEGGEIESGIAVQHEFVVDDLIGNIRIQRTGGEFRFGNAQRLLGVQRADMDGAVSRAVMMRIWGSWMMQGHVSKLATTPSARIPTTTGPRQTDRPDTARNIRNRSDMSLRGDRGKAGPDEHCRGTHRSGS